jgi:hypothetical protein
MVCFSFCFVKFEGGEPLPCPPLLYSCKHTCCARSREHASPRDRWIYVGRAFMLRRFRVGRREFVRSRDRLRRVVRLWCVTLVYGNIVARIRLEQNVIKRQCTHIEDHLPPPAHTHTHTHTHTQTRNRSLPVSRTGTI